MPHNKCLPLDIHIFHVCGNSLFFCTHKRRENRWHVYDILEYPVEHRYVADCLSYSNKLFEIPAMFICQGNNWPTTASLYLASFLTFKQCRANLKSSEINFDLNIDKDPLSKLYTINTNHCRNDDDVKVSAFYVLLIMQGKYMTKFNSMEYF
jgi:hypothetical protein